MEHNSRLVSRGGCQPAVFVSAGPAGIIFFFRNGFHPPCLFNGACQGRFAPPGTGCFCRRAKDSSSPHCHRRTGSTPLFFSSCRRMGKFRTPGAGCFWHAFARGRFAPPGAAAPKNPVDVQQSAIVSYRRMDIVLPLHSLPGLRPCLGGHPSRFSPDTAPGAVGNGRAKPFPQVTTAP